MNTINIINFTQPTTSGWLVDIIVWLVKISSSVAVGVILFTLLLKLVTIPFDAYSKISMKKNSIKMEEMRPELEKLQKQYAGDKTLYSQKMMALYKKNGYSMWGACLPTIITLVIFIVAINAFQNYSRFQNRQNFYEMSQAYNEVIYEYEESGDLVELEKGKYKIVDESKKDTILNDAREASAKKFREVNSTYLFGLGKNIFMEDTSFANPIYDKFEEFAEKFDYDREESSFSDEDYQELIYNLQDEQDEPNGYFILIALTILSSLGMQVIMNKTQKAQLELQTVDGQGARTQKMMTWMMPLLMAIFAFMYTAAFSIYIIVNSVLSLGFTLFINFIIGKKYNKIKEAVAKEKVRGRIYVPKEEPKKEEPVKKNKNAIPDNDFLSGKADKKRR